MTRQLQRHQEDIDDTFERLEPLQKASHSLVQSLQDIEKDIKRVDEEHVAVQVHSHVRQSNLYD